MRLRIVKILFFRMQIEIFKIGQDFKIKMKDCQKKEQSNKALFFDCLIRP
jgi:hypothetical protein